MHRERLQQMVTMLRGLPEEKRERFNLVEWDCGTSACAVGHACCDPVFMSQGLTLGRYWDDGGYPVFEGKEGWCAVRKFFDLSAGVADLLFSSNSYEAEGDTTPGQVATRIESFLAEHAETCNAAPH